MQENTLQGETNTRYTPLRHPTSSMVPFLHTICNTTFIFPTAHVGSFKIPHPKCGKTSHFDGSNPDQTSEKPPEEVNIPHVGGKKPTPFGLGTGSQINKKEQTEETTPTRSHGEVHFWWEEGGGA